MTSASHEIFHEGLGTFHRGTFQFAGEPFHRKDHSPGDYIHRGTNIFILIFLCAAFGVINDE